MAKIHQAGFTLVEVMIVFAISGLLLVIAFVGQGQIRARTQFDASVNKLVATVADARNEATAGVNIVGSGDGTTSADCPGHTNDASRKYVFAGTMWQADDASGTGAFSIHYYKAEVIYPDGPGSDTFDGVACEFDSKTMDIPWDMSVNATNPAGQKGYRLMFVRTPTAALNVCKTTDMTLALDSGKFDPAPPPTVALGQVFSSQASTCVVPSSGGDIINLKDSDGRTSQLKIDSSGLASRLN